MASNYSDRRHSARPCEAASAHLLRDLSVICTGTGSALLMQGERGRVYNVGSGAEVRLGDILNRLILLANIPARVIQDPQRMRPAEQRRMRADIRTVQDGTGWRAAFSLDRTLGDILEYWKETLANE